MIWNAQVGPWRQSRQATRKALQPLTKILPTLSGFKTQRRSIKPFANDNTRIPARGAGHSWLKLNLNVVCHVQCCWAVQCFYREGVHYEIRQHAVSRVSKSTLDIWRHSVLNAMVCQRGRLHHRPTIHFNRERLHLLGINSKAHIRLQNISCYLHYIQFYMSWIKQNPQMSVLHMTMAKLVAILLVT